MSGENNAMFLRLNNGEDLIASTTLVPEKDSKPAYYIINNPMKIVYLTGNGVDKPAMTVAMMPWVYDRICEKQEFHIAERDVLIISEASEMIVKFYNNSIESQLNKNEDLDFEEDVEFGEEEDESLFGTEEEQSELLHKIIEHLKASKKTLH